MNQERLQQLLGDSKEDAERRLKERLALRKKRVAEGGSTTGQNAPTLFWRLCVKVR